MEAPARPVDEADRLDALRRLALLDTPPEERFDRITRRVAAAFGVPIALLTLVDVDRQWFKSCVGLGIDSTSREVSFCGHAILRDEIFVIPDALADPRFADNPLVTGAPHIRFYAGRPLHALEGERVATLCMIDTQPRHLSAEELVLFDDLGAWAEIELRSGEQQDALRALAEIEQLREQLVSTVSHEMRTPLTTVIGFLDLVRGGHGGSLTPEQAALIDVAGRGARHLVALTDDLLLLAALDSGGGGTAHAKVDVADVVEDLIRELAPMADAEDVRFDVDVAGGVVVRADAERLCQAVANLLSNAVKYSGGGGDVRVRVTSKEDTALIEVIDRGVGIPADELAKVGQRFYRATTGGGVRGTGLGLAITRRIVSAHGGTLAVESTVGEGSTFCISLPLAAT